jgi:hypothetical protein
MKKSFEKGFDAELRPSEATFDIFVFLSSLKAALKYWKFALYAGALPIFATQVERGLPSVLHSPEALSPQEFLPCPRTLPHRRLLLSNLEF